MNVWRQILDATVTEALRWSQELDGRKILPNAFEVQIPDVGAEKLAPVLAAATAEVGAALGQWARRESHAWYREAGPLLTVRLAGVAELRIDALFLSDTPGPGAECPPSQALVCESSVETRSTLQCRRTAPADFW